MYEPRIFGYRVATKPGKEVETRIFWHAREKVAKERKCGTGAGCGGGGVTGAGCGGDVTGVTAESVA